MQCLFVFTLGLSGVLSKSDAEKTVSHGLPRLSPYNHPYQPYPAPLPSYHGYAPYMPPRININHHLHSVHKSHDPNIPNDRYVSPLSHGSKYSKSAPSVITFRSPGSSPGKILDQTPDQAPSNSTKDPPLESTAPETKPSIPDQEHTPGSHVDQDTENYNFGYAVKDDLAGDDFSHQVTNNGRKTEGEYRVALPDGRVQIVTYFADQEGYHAEVNYEGGPHENVHHVPRQSAPVVLVKKQPHNHSVTREHSHKQHGRLQLNPFHSRVPQHETPLGEKPARDYVLSRKNQLKETYQKLAPILHSSPFPHSGDVQSLGLLRHPNSLHPAKHPSPHGHPKSNHKLVPSIPHSSISYSTTTATPTHSNPSTTSNILPVHILAHHAPPHLKLSVQDRRPNPFLTNTTSIGTSLPTPASPAKETPKLLPAFHPDYKHPVPVLHTTPSPHIRHHSSPFPHFSPAHHHNPAPPLSQEPRAVEQSALQNLPISHSLPTKLPHFPHLPAVHSTFSPKVIHHSSPVPSNYSPTPTVVPTSASKNVLSPTTPTPSYAPSATPIYAPSPTPRYVPSPTPRYAPSPTPKYAPSPSPKYAPSPTPKYAPSPTPKYAPSPSPKYAPSPTPTYVSSPTPRYVSSPIPRYIPSPAPKYAPSPTPKYAPSPTPKYAPSPTPKPVHTQKAYAPPSPTRTGFLYTNPKSVVKNTSPSPICYPPPCSVHPSSPTPIFHPKPHHQAHPTSPSPIPPINFSSSISPISHSTPFPIQSSTFSPVTQPAGVLRHSSNNPGRSPIPFTIAPHIASHSTPNPFLKSPSPTPIYHSGIKYTKSPLKVESDPKVPKPR